MMLQLRLLQLRLLRLLLLRVVEIGPLLAAGHSNSSNNGNESSRFQKQAVLDLTNMAS